MTPKDIVLLVTWIFAVIEAVACAVACIHYCIEAFRDGDWSMGIIFITLGLIPIELCAIALKWI